MLKFFSGPTVQQIGFQWHRDAGKKRFRAAAVVLDGAHNVSTVRHHYTGGQSCRTSRVQLLGDASLDWLVADQSDVERESYSDAWHQFARGNHSVWECCSIYQWKLRLEGVQGASCQGQIMITDWHDWPIDSIHCWRVIHCKGWNHHTEKAINNSAIRLKIFARYILSDTFIHTFL